MTEPFKKYSMKLGQVNIVTDPNHRISGKSSSLFTGKSFTEKLPLPGSGKYKMRAPTTSTTLPGQVSIFTGERYFYGLFPRFSLCSHSPLCAVWDYNDSKPVGCGLCHLQALFETEFPKRLHEYDLLAENGNPETSPRFWAHVESQMGLVPPKPGESLHSFRASRARSYKQPSRQQHPVTSSLWKMMGYQPKLAHPLILALLAVEMTTISSKFQLSTYQVHETLGKGVRWALRDLRS